MINLNKQLLDYEVISKEFPKSTNKLKDFVKTTLFSFQSMIKGEIGNSENIEIPEISDDIILSATKSLLQINPRLLFDFFDQNDIHTAVYINSESSDSWIYWNNKLLHSNSASNRHEAEYKAFMEAFSTMENLLK